MRFTFRGRSILPGNVSGTAVVSRRGFNTYASFFSSIHEPSDKAICADSGNADLYQVDLAGKIICLPATTGSTSSGAVWQRLAQMGNAPRAVLFSRRIDSLAAGGLIVADIWAGKRIVVVDQLGDVFLETVTQGDSVTIHESGEILLHHPN